MPQAAEYEYTGEKPLNREPEIEDLLSSFITTKGPYDRNHGPIPEIDPEKHVVHVDGAVNSPLELSIAQLRNDFEQHEVLCALQCAGNRRHTMRTLIKEVQGIDWFDGAVMNCRWKGPLLRDVIAKAGVQDSMKETEKGFKGFAALACHEQSCQEEPWYGGSVELQRAMNPDAEAILALEMNGSPLTPKHGAPVRVIVPGVAGARSVKWLNRITIQEKDSENFYQQHDYKILPPDATDNESAEPYWDKIPPIMDMPINSVVGIPKNGSTIKVDAGGMVEAKGYALPHGSDGPIVRVEVSGDGGKTWTDAELSFGDTNQEDNGSKLDHDVKFAWCLWHAKVKVERGEGRSIICRATDKGGNSQPQHAEWNLRGVAYNAWDVTKDLTIV